jgi:hypothetical protein
MTPLPFLVEPADIRDAPPSASRAVRSAWPGVVQDRVQPVGRLACR